MSGGLRVHQFINNDNYEYAISLAKDHGLQCFLMADFWFCSFHVPLTFVRKTS